MMRIHSYLTFAGNEKRSRNIASGSIFDVKSGFGVHFFRKLNESCAFCRTNELFTFSYELESTKLDLFNGINNTDVYFIFVQKLSSQSKETMPVAATDALPSSRVAPVNACPVLRPRWCPAHSPRRHLRWRYPLRPFGCAWSLMSTIASPYRVQDCCFPLIAQRQLSPLFSGLSQCPRLYQFRGSIARPAPLIPPASYSRYRFCTWGVLPACWLGFSWVGLAALCCSPTGQH